MPDSLSQKSGCLGFLQKLFGSLEGGGAGGRWPYAKKQYLLSRAEFSFYRVLRQVCGDRYVICPKVRVGDLVYVEKGTEKRMGWVNKINRSHIDFVLCDPQTMQPIAAVELDDASHNSEKAQQRDADKNRICQTAGLVLFRFRAKRSYDPNAIAAQLAKLRV